MGINKRPYFDFSEKFEEVETIISGWNEARQKPDQESFIEKITVLYDFINNQRGILSNIDKMIEQTETTLKNIRTIERQELIELNKIFQKIIRLINDLSKALNNPKVESNDLIKNECKTLKDNMKKIIEEAQSSLIKISKVNSAQLTEEIQNLKSALNDLRG